MAFSNDWSAVPIFTETLLRLNVRLGGKVLCDIDVALVLAGSNLLQTIVGSIWHRAKE